MKLFKIILLIFICNIEISAQVTERNILVNQIPLSNIQTNLIKRDAWKPFPKLSTEWKVKLPQELIDIHIKDAEALNDYLFPSIPASVMLDFVRSGDRLRHSGIHFTKRKNLMTLVLAESMEGKGRFVEQIMNGVWSICEESYWGVPAHVRSSGLPNVEDPYVDLFAAETGACMALTDYFIGEEFDKINPLIRKRIYAETDERIFNQMLTKSSGYGYMNRKVSVNNWNPWIMSNYITAALFLEKDETRRAKMAFESLHGMDAYLNGLGDDGGCDEGPSYWFAAGACVFDCLDMLYSAAPKATNVYQHPLMQKMASYVYKTHIAGKYFTNFADADPTVEADGVVLYRFGKAINDPILSDFGVYVFKKLYENDYANPAVKMHQNHLMRKVQNLLSFDEISKKQSSYTAPKDVWISDIQLMLSRSNDDQIVFAAHGGHNAESHNHNDVGDFIVYKNGKPLLVDAGRGNYTARTFSAERYNLWFTQSEYHNLPIINGAGQQVGRQFEATDVKYEKTGTNVKLKMNIAKAYPVNAKLLSWTREMDFDKSKLTITLSDDFQLNQNASLDQIFMTVAQVLTNQNGKIVLTDEEARLTIHYDAKLWNVTTEYPSTEGMEYESFNKKWAGKKVQRIILKHKAPVIKGKHGFKISFE